MADSSQKTYSFHDVTLQTGDVVSFQAVKSSAPSQQLQGAVIEVTEDGLLSVFSPYMFSVFGLPGDTICFKAENVSDLQVICRAAEAVPLQSGRRAFALNERVATMVEQNQYEGNVIAAFDQILVVCVGDEGSIRGGAPHFRRLVKV